MYSLNLKISSLFELKCIHLKNNFFPRAFCLCKKYKCILFALSFFLFFYCIRLLQAFNKLFTHFYKLNHRLFSIFFYWEKNETLADHRCSSTITQRMLMIQVQKRNVSVSLNFQIVFTIFATVFRDLLKKLKVGWCTFNNNNGDGDNNG